MPKISVVIPCYNHGQYLDEAVNSVFDQTYCDFEIIVVNDGSSDELTLRKLAGYDRPKVRVIHTANHGLASARNNGISAAEGEYILPLDADDRIGPTYLEKGCALLDENEHIGIVYSLAELFGKRSGRWALPEFSPDRLLIDNLIFCSSFFRKKDWQRIGGYNPNMRFGWEDWDFWLSMIELGKNVVMIPEVLFYYRVKHASMNASMTTFQKMFMMCNLVRNHKNLYMMNIPSVIRSIIIVKLLKRSACTQLTSAVDS